MKIVVLDGYTTNPGDLSWEGLKSFGECVIYERTSVEQIYERIGDAEIVFTNKTPLNSDIFNAKKQLKFVCVLATGFNVVDVDSASEHGVIVTNIPAYSTVSVAQLVFALLLEMCHHVAYHSKTVFDGKWSNCRDFCYWDYPLIELAGKTFGIIGYGRIGSEVASIAGAFGMQVIAFNKDKRGISEDGKVKLCRLDEVLATSDILSLHCPLTDATTGLIDTNTLSKMKDGAILINTARGPLINERNVREALESGKLAGFAADVLSAEPPKEGSPLIGAPNCFITPHFGWAPKASRERLLNIAQNNLKCYLEGNPVNVVNV